MLLFLYFLSALTLLAIGGQKFNIRRLRANDSNARLAGIAVFGGLVQLAISLLSFTIYCSWSIQCTAMEAYLPIIQMLGLIVAILCFVSLTNDSLPKTTRNTLGLLSLILIFAQLVLYIAPRFM
jgi:hypothetical protein